MNRPPRCRRLLPIGLLAMLLGGSVGSATGSIVTVHDRTALPGPGQVVDDSIDWSQFGPSGTTVPVNGSNIPIHTTAGQTDSLSVGGGGDLNSFTVGTLQGLPSIEAHAFSSFDGFNATLATVSVAVTFANPVVAVGMDVYELASILGQPVGFGASTKLTVFDTHGNFLAGGNLGSNPYQGFVGFRSDSGAVIGSIIANSTTVFPTDATNQNAYVQLNRIDLVTGATPPQLVPEPLTLAGGLVAIGLTAAFSCLHRRRPFVR